MEYLNDWLVAGAAKLTAPLAQRMPGLGPASALPHWSALLLRSMTMPLVTFTVKSGGFSSSEKATLSQAMLEAQVAAGFAKNDLFHRFLEVDPDHLLIDPQFPAYLKQRTDRFVLAEVILSAGQPQLMTTSIADEAVRLFGERLNIGPQDILFVFQEVNSASPRFPQDSAGN